MSIAEKRKYYGRGLFAEALAALFFRLKGYRILARRYKTPMGEIDLIAARGKALVFIEVKARSSAEAGMEAVRPRARARIENAARHFLAARPQFTDYDLRFDVIVYAGVFSITHLDNAWAARS